jgi:import inner membrane translocase subunit TIM44
VDITKKGYGILKEELSSNSPKRQRVRFTPSGETSTKTDLVVTPSNQSRWSKKFDEIKDKVIVLQIFRNWIAYTLSP